MKTIFKRALVMTAFVAASAVNAQAIEFPQPFSDTSTETLVFSSDVLRYLTFVSVSLTTSTVIPSNLNLPNGGMVNTATYKKDNSTLVLTGSSLTSLNKVVSSLTASNSLLRFSRVVVEDNGDVSLYRVYLADFEFNLAQATIYANLYATDPAGTMTSFGKTALFQAAGVTGGAYVFDANGPTATGALTGELRLTTQGGDILLNSLGLNVSPGNTLTDLLLKSSWGTASFTTPAVPEPSSWALFGIGLLGLGALARRRQA